MFKGKGLIYCKNDLVSHPSTFYQFAKNQALNERLRQKTVIWSVCMLLLFVTNKVQSCM